MPEKRTIELARRDKRQGKSASTQAGEFVRQEIHHIREGKHGARSTKQAIAIGLSEARRAGIALPPPKNASPAVRKQAARDSAKAHAHTPVSPKRSRAAKRALEHEGHSAASPAALSRHARSAAAHHTKAERSGAARAAARTRKRTSTRRGRGGAS